MAIAGDSQAKLYGWYIDKKINIKAITDFYFIDTFKNKYKFLNINT